MRAVLVVIHRWAGLFSAIFLFVAGVTGALIAWDHELDALLNPAFYETPPARAEALPALVLAEQLERADPRLRVQYLPLAPEPDHAALIGITPRIDPLTGQPFVLDFNQVALDPRTGEQRAKRFWGAVSLRRENLLPFLYKLHYSLHLPEAGDIDCGMLLMGIVAIVWFLDGIVALWISFPNPKTWRKSFAFRFRAGGYRLLFDLHRSGGVWVWPLLVALAFTAISMNLGRQVVRPAVALFSPLSADPFSLRTPRPPDRPIEPVLSRAEVLAQAAADGRMRKLAHPPGAIFYSPAYGVYGVGFFAAGNDHGDGGLGNPWLYYDVKDGQLIGSVLPGTGSAGDIFMQAQFPIHSGRILGLAGRIAVTLLGLVVAALSVTGVVIWARKRRARTLQARKNSEHAGQSLAKTS
jgi:uncharacterized iron-regulated membrane protein